MKFSLTHHKDDNKRLILIFAGWSTGVDLYSDIIKEDWDTAVVSDFSSLDFPYDELKKYSTIYLYAWSLGVWAASRVITADENISMAFAINGTEFPVNDELGIPSSIFKGTADNLDDRNLSKFRKRMLNSNDPVLMEKLGKGSEPVAALKDELLSIMKASEKPHESNIRWRRAYIGKHDRIFPPANQARAWNSSNTDSEEIYELDDPHYIAISRIVNATIPDTAKVGKRFQTSARTYDSEAKAQSIIIRRLTDIIKGLDITENGNVLEIGQGTGLFTHSYAPVVKPSSIDYVDLYPTRHFNLAPAERYYVRDAELWIDETESSYDMILSASTIQWFRNLDRFFMNSAKVLKQDGVLACSTFLPGTLSKFDQFRPSPMLYIPAEEICRMAEKYFNSVYTEEDSIEIVFDSPKEAMRHLRETGVGGAFGRFGTIRDMFKSITDPDGRVTLLFRALYIVAKKSKH